MYLMQLTREAKMCSHDIKQIHQNVLTEADVICCTLTSSGSHRLRECFQRKPQYFTAVIIDEAAQCSELLTLIPLLYHSTKLVLVGDPAQLPATVKSVVSNICRKWLIVKLCTVNFTAYT